MHFLPAIDVEELHQYHRIVTHSVKLRSHLEVLVWLQGDMQRYLPHNIMIAAWGDFKTGDIQHDIISILDGVRSQNSNPLTIAPMLMRFFARWSDCDKKAFALSAGTSGFLLGDSGQKCELAEALQKMRCAMVHGIKDERGSHDCLYVAFSSGESFDAAACDALTQVLPYIDNALRQVEHLPHQSNPRTGIASAADSRALTEQGLTERELEIVEWIAMGKTNPEIGSILEISVFTVKNHVQRIFKKLNVSNRAQAVAALTNNA